MPSKKKDFTAVDTNPVHMAIAETIAEPDPVPAEKPRRGRKPGLLSVYNKQSLEEGKTIRMSVALPIEFHDYLKSMAGAMGMPMNDFLNLVIKKSMEENEDTYNKVKSLQFDIKLK